MIKNFRKKIFIFSGMFFIIVIGYIIFDINIKKSCKNIPRVIQSLNDFGTLAIKGCKNPLGIKPYFREKTPGLFRVLQSLKSKYSKHKNRNQFSFKQLSDEELKTLQKNIFQTFQKI